MRSALATMVFFAGPGDSDSDSDYDYGNSTSVHSMRSFYTLTLSISRVFGLFFAQNRARHRLSGRQWLGPEGHGTVMRAMRSMRSMRWGCDCVRWAAR
jgi:hypothetical protein